MTPTRAFNTRAAEYTDACAGIGCLWIGPAISGRMRPPQENEPSRHRLPSWPRSPTPASNGQRQPSRIPVTPAPPGGINAEDLQYVATHTPVLTEEGLATWYTAPYKGRKSANGEVFEDSRA